MKFCLLRNKRAMIKSRHSEFVDESLLSENIEAIWWIVN